MRKGSDAVSFQGIFQSVGTENLGPKVSVGGTGYVLGLGYVHTYSADFKLSAGIAHLSSHLTRDLDDKLEEETGKGAAIPLVEDPSEYNVFFFKAYRKFSAYRFTPELEIAVEPVNFNFNGGRRDYVRPVYLGTRSTLWQGSQKSIVAGTQHGGSARMGAPSGNSLYPRNPHSPAPALRALLVALDQWVTAGIAPPDSRVPSSAAESITTIVG